MPKPVGETGGGMANAIVGIADAHRHRVGRRRPGRAHRRRVPVGIRRTSRFASLVRFTADVLNGVPSIVIGIFAYGLAVLPVQALLGARRRARARLHDDPDHHAHDRGAAEPRAPRACGRARSRSGATRARAAFCVMVPAALPGIMTGILVALARIAGETAPLLFTSFNNRFFTDAPGSADRVADRAGLHLRDLALRRLAPAGLGRARSSWWRSIFLFSVLASVVTRRLERMHRT